MTKQEISELIYKLRELKKINPNGYEEIKTFIYELHGNKNNKACNEM